MSDENGGVCLSLPLPQEQVFRYQATGDILELLYRNPHKEFTVTQLRETTDHGGKSVDNALQTLETLDLVEKEKKGRKTLVRINQEKISKPDDPILEIPQKEFRKPVKQFLDKAITRQDNLVGIILFGSVARGEADRASDIDIQVIVEDDLLETRRELQDLRQQVEEQRFAGNRYRFQLLVESTETVEQYGDKLREIFSQGIILYSTTLMKDVKEAVFHG